MKKLFTCMLLAAASVTAWSEDFTVYSNGVLTADCGLDYWWNIVNNAQAASPTDENVKVWSMTHEQYVDGNFCGGISTSSKAYTGPLHSSEFTFQYYATTPCKITVRLAAGVEENQVIEVTEADVNKWIAASYPVAEAYPQVAAAWNDGNNGGVLAGFVIENFTAETILYVNDIVYKNIDTNWTAPDAPEIPLAPVIEQSQDEVLSVFSQYGVAAFNIGGWGQSTTWEKLEDANGAPVGYMTNFNYLGWELANHIDASKCKYMHVDFYPMTETNFGFTPISPGKEKAYIATDVVAGQWNSYDVELSHWDNVDLTDIFQIKFDQGNTNAKGYLANVYFWGTADIEPDPEDLAIGNTYKGTLEDLSVEQTMNDETKTYPYSLEYAVKYNDDKTLTIKTNLKWTAGEPIGIIAGAANVAGVSYDFTLDNGLRTVTTTATFELGEKLEITIVCPYALGLLSEKFNYTVGSGEIVNDDDPEDPEEGTGAVYADEINNSYSQTLEGETKEYSYKLTYDITWNTDRTLTINAMFDWADDAMPVGMIPGSVFVNNILCDFTETSSRASTTRTATTVEKYSEGQTIPVNIYIPVAADVIQVPFNYTVGSEHQISAIAGIETTTDAPAIYYNLQGIRVDNPGNGLYIKVQDGKTTKVLLN